MRYTIQSNEIGCTLTAVNHHTSVKFPLPIQAGDLTAALAALLRDPESREVEEGGVVIVRTTDGVSIRTAQGRFDLPWPHLFALEGVPHA